jgi:hypothetical protein
MIEQSPPAPPTAGSLHEPMASGTAVLGGIQSLHTNSLDETLALRRSTGTGRAHFMVSSQMSPCSMFRAR